MPKRTSKLDMFIRTMTTVAKGEVGTMEVGGNNLGPRVRVYQAATWLTPGSWPWCAAFICFIIKESERILGWAPYSGKRPRTAGAFDFENWANNQSNKDNSYKLRAGDGVSVFSPDESFKYKEGDIVIYKYSHIEYVIGNGTHSKFPVIGGNTGSGDERDGDGVWDKFGRGKNVRWVLRFTG